MLLMPCPVESEPLLPASLTHAWSELAWRAMLTEVNLSPKPGLVDRFNNGAHHDMALDDFHRSASAVRPWLPRFMEAGALGAWHSPVAVLATLRPIGLACEAAMFRATAGVNTHKGSIFALGLLCAALGRLHQLALPLSAAALCQTVSAMCQGLTAAELRHSTPPLTAGQRLYHQLGLTGARGEAEAGYPLVLDHALPHYLALQRLGRDPELALLDTLLVLMAHNGDTNVASRGGSEGLFWLQQQAKRLLSQGGIRETADLARLRQFDRQCITRHLSPGGSADLLIVTWFLAHLSDVRYHFQ